MALIICPECGKTISDKAEKCNCCGCPIEKKGGLYKLVLTSVGREVIKTIKLVRETNGYGLKEAKDCVDYLPSVVVDGVTFEEVKQLQSIFTDLGNITSIEDSLLTVRNDAIVIEGQCNRETEAITAQKSNVTKQNIPDYTAGFNLKQTKCPSCQSDDIKKSSGISILGIFSRKAGKKWHCNNCGNEW